MIQTLPIGFSLLQRGTTAKPFTPVATDLTELSIKGGSTESVQPTFLLTRPRQLLGLTLNGEIDQQGTQNQQLLTIDHHAIEPRSTAETFLLTPPFATHHQLLLAVGDLLLPQPAAGCFTGAKSGLNDGTVTAGPQQARTGTRLQTAKHGIKSIKKNRLSCACLAGQHGKTLIKCQIKAVDQCDVLESQAGQHGRPRCWC